MNNFVQEGKVLKGTAPTGGVTSGQGLVINGRFVVAQNPADAGGATNYVQTGVVKLPKAAVAILPFQALYWNPDEEEITNVATRADADGDADVSAIEAVATPVVANTTKTYLQYVPAGHVVDAIGAMASVTPASSAGTLTLAGAKVGGNNILGAATVDLKTLTGGTQATITPTATLADRTFTTAGWIKWTVTSNNADATGGADLNMLVSLRPTTLANIPAGCADGAGAAEAATTANVRLP